MPTARILLRLMESLTTKRCYEMLGLEPNATPVQIKEAYRQLARQWHPDRVAHNPKLQAIALEEMKVINAAYDALKSYQPTSRSAPSDKKSEPEENVRNRGEEAKQRAAAEQRQRETEQKERETARRKRETDRLRVQQEAEDAYQSEQLASAKKEAERKQEEASRVRESQGRARRCVKCGDSIELCDMPSGGLMSLVFYAFAVSSTNTTDPIRYCMKCTLFGKS